MGHFLGFFAPSVDISEGLVTRFTSTGVQRWRGGKGGGGLPRKCNWRPRMLWGPASEGKALGRGLLLAEGAAVTVLVLAVSERSEEPQICPGVAVR